METDYDGMYQIHFLDEKRGAMLSNHEIFLTEDGGETWKEGPDFRELSGLDFVSIATPCIMDENSIILQGAVFFADEGRFECHIIRSDDFGETWTVYDKNILPIFDMYFFDDQLGFGVSSYKADAGIRADVILKTTDGGENWFTVLDTVVKETEGLSKIDFADEKYGIAMGRWDKLWRTSDGGDTWHHDTTFYKYRYDYFQFVDISYPDKDVVYAVSSMDGYIWKWTEGGSDVADFGPRGSGSPAYPNPARDAVVIPLGRVCADAEVKAYDCLGRSAGGLHWRPGRHYNELIIDTSALPPGLWLLRVKAGREVFTRKVVKAE